MAMQKASTNQNGASTDARAEDMSITDVHRQFAGKWVLVKTTKVDERREPLRGVVITAGSHTRVLKRLAREIELNGRPEFPYDMFPAGDLVLANGAFPGEDESSPDAADRS
jgi:hypothetical protein